MILQKNYRATLTEELLATTSGEIEIKLSVTPASDTGYVLIEPGVSGKEESSFYHRKSGNSVFIYGVNRDNPTTHSMSASVMLTNSIDSLNYILSYINESMYIFKKDIQNIKVSGGKFFINNTIVEIAELDTSLATANKILVPNSTNYLYIKNNDYFITITEDPTLYLISEIVVDAAGDIQSISKERLQCIPGLAFTQDERDRLAALEMAEIYSLEGVPEVGLGINGDIYLDQLTSNVYKKESGVWVLKFNIKGLKGDTGDQLQLRVDSGYIQWKLVGGEAWTNLVSILDISGVDRVITTTDDATAVIDVALTDVYELSAIANATTFSTTGTPKDGQNIIIRFKDAGVAKAITWDAIFVAIGITLPTTTVAGKRHYVGAKYNSNASKFHCIAYTVQA